MTRDQVIAIAQNIDARHLAPFTQSRRRCQRAGASRAHLRWMVAEIADKEFITDHKATLWLGYIQGVLRVKYKVPLSALKGDV